MPDPTPEITASDGGRLPTDRGTLACVALGGALAAVIANRMTSAPAWRSLDADSRLIGLAGVAVLVGVLFGFHDRLGPRWMGLLVFGFLGGFASVGVYSLVGMLGMPPEAGVRFLLCAPPVAAAGIAAGLWPVRRWRRR
ncbi:hypothetical protein [Tsukamurella serpentis]